MITIEFTTPIQSELRKDSNTILDLIKPEQWQDFEITKASIKQKVTKDADADEPYTIIQFITADKKDLQARLALEPLDDIGLKYELLEATFSWDGQEDSWINTPMSTMLVESKLQEAKDDHQKERSSWAIRNDLLNDIYNPQDDDTEDNFDTLIKLGELLKDELDNQPDDTDDIIFDGVYDLDKAEAWDLNKFNDYIATYWYQYQQTVVNYLKENNVTITNIYTVMNVSAVQLINASLYAITTNLGNDKPLHFDNLSYGQQVSIVEELLNRKLI